MDGSAFVSLALGVLVLGALCQGLVGAIRSGGLDRNGMVGIRTSATLLSEEAWQAGHRAAVPRLRLAGMVGLLLGGLSVPIGVIALVMGQEPPVGLLAVPVGGLTVEIVLLLMATTRAHRAAARIG